MSLQKPNLLWPLGNHTCEQEVKMINTFDPRLFCNQTFVNQTNDNLYTAMVLNKHIDVRVDCITKEKDHYSFGEMFLLKKLLVLFLTINLMVQAERLCYG